MRCQGGRITCASGVEIRVLNLDGMTGTCAVGRMRGTVPRINDRVSGLSQKRFSSFIQDNVTMIKTSELLGGLVWKCRSF